MALFKEDVESVLDRMGFYTQMHDYFEGEVTEKFYNMSRALRRAIRDTGIRANLNFCAPVVSAVNNRLEIAAITTDNPTADEVINRVWSENNLDLDSREQHLRTLSYGETFAVVLPDEGEWQVSQFPPTMMSMIYDPENPRKKDHAVGLWKLEPSRHRLKRYFADRIESYEADSTEVTGGTEWRRVGTEDNPYGEVPVFHFRTRKPNGKPEHFAAIDAQDAINKLFITNMFTVDYQGAPQRFALANTGSGEIDDFEEGDTDRENLGALKAGPGQLWYLKGVNSVGEFSPADPAVFWDPIKDSVRTIASLTDTPLHYFEKTGMVQSGQALRAAEAPLNQKIKDRKNSFGYTWRQVFNFILRNEGFADAAVQVFWENVESLDELERWDVAIKKINAGLSNRQALREGGYSEAQIDKIMAERAAEDLIYSRAGSDASANMPTRAARVSTEDNETLPIQQEE